MMEIGSNIDLLLLLLSFLNMQVGVVFYDFSTIPSDEIDERELRVRGGSFKIYFDYK